MVDSSPQSVEAVEQGKQHNSNRHGIRLLFDLPDELLLIPYIRKSTRHMMESLYILPEDIEALELILAELATNAICHASGGSYQAILELSGFQATVTVVDKGNGFSLDNLPEPGTPRPNCFPDDISSPSSLSQDSEEQEQLRIGGFGLILVLGLADQFEVSPNAVSPGMTVRASKMVRSKASHLPPFGEKGAV